MLAPAGAILPLAADAEPGSAANPEALELRVYAGADGEFALAEDQDDERWAETRFTFAGGEVRIHPGRGRARTRSRRRAATTSCSAGSRASRAVEVDGTESADRPGPGPGQRRDRACRPWPRPRARCCGCVGDPAPAGNPDVPERLFALLDAAQIELTDQGSACTGRVTTHDAGAAPSPRSPRWTCRGPLFDRVVELLLADVERPAAGARHGPRSVGAYMRSGAAIPSSPSPSRSVAAASRHSASRFARTPSAAESTGQFS